MKLTNPVTAIREAAGLSKRDFAEKLGFTRAYIYRREEIDGGVSKPFAVRIRQVFPKEMKQTGITIEHLLLGRMPRTRKTA